MVMGSVGDISNKAHFVVELVHSKEAPRILAFVEWGASDRFHTIADTGRTLISICGKFESFVEQENFCIWHCFQPRMGLNIVWITTFSPFSKIK